MLDTSSSSEVSDVETQEVHLSTKELITERKFNRSTTQDLAPTDSTAKLGAGNATAKARPHESRNELPLTHPTYPSQSTGNRFERRAVLILVGCFCAIFTSFGWINCIGIFMTIIKRIS